MPTWPFCRRDVMRDVTRGEHLAEELDALKMTAAEPARRLNLPTNRLHAVDETQMDGADRGCPSL